MRVIVSHDVDHLFITEHWKDRFIPGLIYKSLLELLEGDLRGAQVFNRFRYRQHRIPELLSFNSSQSIPSSFFFGMASGLSLSYSQKAAAPIIQNLSKKGLFIGTHGMAFDDKHFMQKEMEGMSTILGSKVRGIRNHYLRQSESTKKILAELGYEFDSTDRGLFNPVNVNGMWSIPISIMDVDVVRPRRSEKDIWRETEDLVHKALELELEYFVINFHDIYFDKNSYPVHYSWYIKLISLCQNLELEFSDFDKVIKELNQDISPSQS